MELAKQIKKYRTALHLSQDDLAEKIYVTRQTVSNWENEKNYPDIHSILRMATLFDISLDQLIKGDIEIMRKEINAVDLKKFKKKGTIFSILLISAILAFYPLVHFLNMVGVAIWGAWMAVTFYFAIVVEKEKKQNNIQTYKEITAFYNGVTLDEIEKEREAGKRPYQKLLAAIVCAIIMIVILVLFKLLFRFLGG